MPSLEDLLQHRLGFKGVRILTYGFNGTYTDVNEKMVAPEPIPECAHALLDSLMMGRRMRKEREWPVIFVGNSWGRKVVKQALLITNDPRINIPPSYYSISHSTYGIVSLGTPHIGSYYSEYNPQARLLDVSHRPASSCGLQDYINSDSERIRPRTWRRCLYNGWLAASQIILVAVIGNYKILIRIDLPQTCEPGSEMVGAQSAML